MNRRGGNLLVLVEDNGIGFNPEQKSRTDFPRFGLSTMRERAESIGGTLQIETAPGTGTQVRFLLPIETALAE